EEASEDEEKRHADREATADRYRLRRIAPPRELGPAHVFEDDRERAGDRAPAEPDDPSGGLGEARAANGGGGRKHGERHGERGRGEVERLQDRGVPPCSGDCEAEERDREPEPSRWKGMARATQEDRGGRSERQDPDGDVQPPGRLPEERVAERSQEK